MIKKGTPATHKDFGLGTVGKYLGVDSREPDFNTEERYEFTVNGTSLPAKVWADDLKVEKAKTSRGHSDMELPLLVLDYCRTHMNSAGHVEGGVVRQELYDYAQSREMSANLTARLAKQGWTDGLGSAKKALIALGAVKDIDRQMWVNLSISEANQVALRIVAAGGSLEDGLESKREFAKVNDPRIEELYTILQLRNDGWCREEKKSISRQTPTTKTSEGRESWARDAAVKYLGGVCQVSGDPMYVNGRDNAVDAIHIVALELLQSWGFPALNSPHVLRLLRADIHRRNDSGVSLAKDSPTLKTPPQFADSHAMADELRHRLELLETKGMTR